MVVGQKGGWEQSGAVLPWYYRVGHHGNTMVIPWLPRYYHGYEITEYGFTMVITMVLGWFSPGFSPGWFYHGVTMVIPR